MSTPATPPQEVEKQSSTQKTTITTKRYSRTRNTISLQTAAALSTLTFYPMDVVKMRFMSQDGTGERLFQGRYYNSTIGTLKLISKEEGIKALFRGVHVSILGALVSWGVYMTLYQYFSEAFQILAAQKQGQEEEERNSSYSVAGTLGLSHTILASGFASVASAVAGNPIWMVKTRMQLEVAKNASAVAAGTVVKEELRYETLRGGLRFIYKDTGFRSFWRGLSAQLVLSLPNAATFPLYEWFKQQRRIQLGIHNPSATNDYKSLSLPDTCACSVSSKIIVSIMSHPWVVVKTRLMDERSHQGQVKYTSFFGTCTNIAKREGVQGFFRGMGPSMMQSVPRNVLHFAIYESLLKLLPAGI